MTRDLPPGIRRTYDDTGQPVGYQAYVWRQDPTKPKGGYQAARRFPVDASLAEMRSWRQEQKLRGTHPELFAEVDPTATTFAEDAREYLTRPSVRRMPTYKERAKHIGEWVALFGRRSRSSIEPREIQHALDRLRVTLEASSVNNRRTALMHLWTTLDGRHQANPVKATTKAREPDVEPRAPALVDVLTLLKKFPARTDYGQKCQARLEVIAWTGWPHVIVKQLDPKDLPHWKQGRAFVPARGKGHGARARWLPLLPQGVAALKKFVRVEAHGHFSNSSLYRRVQKACKVLELPPIRVYDLRHFFGTLVATLTRDERAIMELMLLSTPAMVRRYTNAATNPRVQAAVASIVKQLPGLLKSAANLKRSRHSAAAENGGPQGVRRGAKSPRRIRQSRKNRNKLRKTA